MSSRKLTKLLTEAGLLPEDAANEFLQQEKNAEPLTLDSLICKNGFAQPVQLDHFLAEAFRLPKVDLPQVLSPQKEALALLDAEQVSKFQVFPYAVDDEHLSIVAALPLRLTRIQTLSETTGRNLKISALNQVYFALLAEQYYQIAPPDELIPLIDEWPLPIPEEAADMIYIPPPKEIKKKTKTLGRSEDTDPHTSDEPANASVEVSAVSLPVSPSSADLPANTDLSEPTQAFGSFPPAESALSTKPETSTESALSTKPETSTESALSTKPETSTESALSTKPETSTESSTPAKTASPPEPPLKKQDPAKRASEEAKLALMDVTDILGFEMTELLGGTLPALQLDDLLVSSPAISTTGSLTDLPITSPIETEKPATTETAAPVTKAPLVGLESMPTVILPLGVYEAEYLLRNAQTRDGVLELGLYFFATKLQHAALFLIRKQSAKGLRMIGPADLDKAFQNIEISLDASAFFSAMLNALVPYSGSPSEDDADRPLFSLFSLPPKHVYLLPVRVRGRTVAILYGHTLQDALSHEEFEQLIRCTYQMAQSLEHVILAVKKGVTEESTPVTQALDALRKHDDLALRSVLQNGRSEINAIEAESLAAIERVQSEEKRIAQERAEKLARSAELARAAREQAAISASQSSQTTDFLDATANPPDLQTSTDVHSLHSQTGDFAAPRAPAPLTQTGDFAATPAPLTQTGDFAATPPPAPVTQTGDFAQTPPPVKETAAYLDAFVVDDETRKRFAAHTQTTTEEKKKVAPEQSPSSISSEKNAEPTPFQTAEPNTTPSQEISDTQTQPPTTSPQQEPPQTPPTSSNHTIPSNTSASSETSTSLHTPDTSEPSDFSNTSALSDTSASSQTSALSDTSASSQTSALPDPSAPLEPSAAFAQTLANAEAEAFPELMPAFDDAPQPAKEARSADVIGAEIASSGDGDGAEISSNAANPNPSQGNADTLLAALLSENAALPDIAQKAEALGTPTPSQQENQTLTERPSQDDRAEDSTHTPSQEASEISDLSFLLTGTLHAPPALPPVSEEVMVLLPMLDDENERMREVALQSFRDLPRDRAIAALLYAIFQQLQPEDILDNGQLSADKQQRPIHTLYQLFTHHKEAASTALCHQLYHLTPEQNTLALRILPHLPLSQSVWPHLMHFVLRLDEHLAKPSLALLEQHKEDPTLQEIAAYLRDQITTEQPDYGARVLRLLQKLHTPEITKATRRFLHVQEPQIAEMAARLTLLSLREQANQDTLPTAPHTPRPLSIEHIFSSDLEDPPALPAPDPILHEIVKLLSLPGDTLHREALLVLRDMPPQRLTHTLLHHFPGSLELSDFNADGELDLQKQKIPDGYVWLLLCQTPESTQGHLLPHLAHKQSRIRLLSLKLLQIFPSFDPLLPYLFRYLLDFNALIVEACRKLLRQVSHSMTFQKILEWMREQLEFSDPTQAIRAVKVLAVLRDTVAVPNLIELVQHEDRELAEAATQALQLITKQILPTQHKPWSKWWNKFGSHSERVDWLIEAIQLKDETIVQAANQELIELTGQDFGLSSEIGRKERNNVIQQWKTWRKQHPIF